jgi:hypothetical protein
VPAVVVGDAVLVSMLDAAVTVGVLVDQVDPEQQVPVGEDLLGRSFPGDAVLPGEDRAAIGEKPQRVEVVRRTARWSCRQS